MFRWVKRLPSKVKGFYAGYPRLTQTYPPRKFPRWFPKPTFCLALFSYLVVIVLIAIATAGYQWVSIVTTSWNDTNSFWFNAFIPDSYRPQTRICAPHNFQIGDSIGVPGPSAFFFNLTDFLDARQGIPLDELVYENYDFVNCSVNSISITPGQTQITVLCNTTEGQVLVLTGSNLANNVNAGIRVSRYDFQSFFSQQSIGELSLGITDALLYFNFELATITEPFLEEMLNQSLGTNITSIVLSYPGQGGLLIPGGQWGLDISFTNSSAISQPTTYTIIFNADGTIDYGNGSGIDGATNVLEGSINYLEDVIMDSLRNPLSFWDLINWYFVSLHWTTLYQFGDIAPTIYGQNALPPSVLLPNPLVNYHQLLLNGIGSPNFSDPVTFPPTNNIFWNETLFEIYTTYFAHIYGSAQQLDLPPFLPPSNSNRIERSPITIFTSYQCNQLGWKGWVSAVFSILVAISSLWTGGYTLFLLLVEAVQEKKKPEGKDHDPPGNRSEEGNVKLEHTVEAVL